MKITKVICSKGRTGFFFDDQRAIKGGAKSDGSAYIGAPVTDGFTAVRQAGESISVMLVLEDGQVAYGDCAAVQYSGAGGRDPLFLAADFIPVIEKNVAPMLVDKEISSFRQMCEELEALEVDGKRLHTAIRYGVSQAILDAVAKSQKKMMCEVIADEYGLKPEYKQIPIFTQSGDSRYDNSDKMIMKGADVLPHALINNVDTKLGRNGEILEEYVKWLAARIKQLRHTEDYNPVLHIDVYALAALTALVDQRGINVEIVADEWCNTLEDIKYFADNKAGHMVQIKTPDLGGINNIAEAVIYCKEKGIGAYQGGTCNETDRSAQVCVNVAMATQPDQILAKPGMGVDEGYMIVYNEMQRILACMEAKNV